MCNPFSCSLILYMPFPYLNVNPTLILSFVLFGTLLFCNTCYLGPCEIIKAGNYRYVMTNYEHG